MSTHPEQQDGEVFITNQTPFSASVGWSTRRQGQIAYDSDGRPISGYFPVFAQRAEIPSRVLAMLDRDNNRRRYPAQIGEK